MLSPSDRTARFCSAFAALAFGASLAAQQPKDGADVLERMKNAYDGKWYHSLTFTQQTTQTRQDGSKAVSTWYESLRHTSATGVELRIDIGDPSAGNGVLYTADSSWRVRAGKLASARADGNEFLPLIEGVYVQPVSRTAAEIGHMNVDMSKVTSGRRDGRPVWIVGTTSASDTTSPQFWVDQQRNVVVRAILRASPTSTMDIALGKYEPIGPAWLATRVVMAVDGKVIQERNTPVGGRTWISLRGCSRSRRGRPLRTG